MGPDETQISLDSTGHCFSITLAALWANVSVSFALVQEIGSQHRKGLYSRDCPTGMQGIRHYVSLPKRLEKFHLKQIRFHKISGSAD